MKVLFLYSYYKPEKTSGKHLAEDLRDGLVEAGHTMQIFTPVPTRGITNQERKEYKHRKNEFEADGAIKVHRFALFREGNNSLLRAFRYAICELQLIWFGLTAKKPDIIPFGSTPPINGIVGTMLKKLRKIPFVYTVQDVFPESLVSTGMTHEGSLLWKIGSWVSNMTYRNADHIIVISDSLKELLVAKGVDENKISVVYNWVDEDAVRPIDRANNRLFDTFSLPRDKFYVTYAGNLGNSQNANLLVDCAEKLKNHDDIQFVIFGDGTEKENMEKRVLELGLDNIKIFPMQSPQLVAEVYSLGDVSFVCGKKGVGRGAFPSKAASIMATATTVVASFDTDSDLCKRICDKNCGICVEPEDVSGAVDAILKLYKDQNLCQELGFNGRRFVEENLVRSVGVKKRIEIFEKYARK